MTPYKGMRCYFLFATILFVNSLALPNGHSDPIFEQRGTAPLDPNGLYDPCPYGNDLWEYTLVASWCLDKKTVQRLCVQNEGNPPDIRRNTVSCGPYAYCQGSQETDPDPRSARCVVDIKRGLRWVTNKLKSSAVLQCVNFQSTSVTGADGLGVQADTTAPNSDPPMPQEAQLFYQGSSYPIQAMDQSSMNDISGFFVFNYVIDYTQVLQFCVNVASTAIVFNLGLIKPVPADLGDLTFTTENKTVYRTFDDAVGIWKEVQLDEEE